MKKLNLNKYDGDPNSVYLFSSSFMHDQELFLTSSFKGEYFPISLTKEDYLKKHEMTLTIFNLYLPHLAQFLNKKNNFNYSLKFWHPFLAYWMVSVIDLYFDKKMKLEIFFSQYDGQLQIELAECSNDFIFSDDPSFNNGHASLSLFEQLFSSLIIEEINPLGHLLSKTNVGQCFFELSTSGQKNAHVNLTSRVEHVAGFNKSQIKILSLTLGINAKIKKAKTEKMAADLPLKENQKFDWMKLFLKMMPVSYLNLDFSKINSPISGGVVIFSSYKTFAKRAIVSLLRERGVKVYLAQHGSNYGDQLTVTRNYVTEYLLDGFISWGWTKHDYHPAHIVPLPSPIISKLKLRKLLSFKKRNKIILVSSVYAPNDTTGSVETAEFYIEYFQNICSFLENLAPETRGQFYYRPRLTHGEITFNNALVKLIQEKYPWVKILHGNLDNEMLKATIVIHDNFGSALQKSLTLCPISLFFWRENSFYLNSDLENVLTKFREQKGYFKTGSEAALELNRMLEKGDKKTNLKPLYGELEAIFFKVSYFPLYHWIKTLTKT